MAEQVREDAAWFGGCCKEMAMAGALTGRTAIVTGASAGIGRAVAEHLSAAGAAVVIAARRAERLREVGGEMEARGGKVLVVETDAGKTADVEQADEHDAGVDGGRQQA